MLICQAALFPSLPPSQAHWYESFPAFYLFIYLLYDALFQLTRFVRLWLCYKSQFRGVLQLKLVLV